MTSSLSSSHSLRTITIGMSTARLNEPIEINLWLGVGDPNQESNIDYNIVPL
jgi:hypothetical protein